MFKLRVTKQIKRLFRNSKSIIDTSYYGQLLNLIEKYRCKIYSNKNLADYFNGYI
jgi:hypothetical protein